MSLCFLGFFCFTANTLHYQLSRSRICLHFWKLTKMSILTGTSPGKVITACSSGQQTSHPQQNEPRVLIDLNLLPVGSMEDFLLTDLLPFFANILCQLQRRRKHLIYALIELFVDVIVYALITGWFKPSSTLVFIWFLEIIVFIGTSY